MLLTFGNCDYWRSISLFLFLFLFLRPPPQPAHPLQAHQLVEAQKRKAADKNNPTLYWEYKWTEDAEAEVIFSVLHSIQLIYNVFVASRKLRPSISGGSRGGTHGARPPLFWVKRKKSQKEESWQGKQNNSPPPLP